LEQEIPIWRIKYHPKNLDQICGRKEVKETLKNIIKQKNFPHLLFVGSKGIGKTLIAYLFSKEFLGKAYDANFKLVYANVPLSEEERKQARSDAYVSTSKIGSIAGRRITTPAFIQARVKPFVQLKVLGGAPFKILVVKNFEALGQNQQGFRRLMEIYGRNCRMILITTKVSSIINPIVSRCQILLISPVKLDDFKDLITKIAAKESLEISEFRNDLIRSLLIVAFKGDFPKARELSRKILSNYKYDINEFFKLMINELNKFPLSKFVRSKLINFIAESEFRALDGRDNDIQVSALLSKICLFSEYL